MSTARDLAAAVRDALDLPYAADREASHERYQLLAERAAYLCGCLGAFADGDARVTAASAIAVIRGVGEYRPVTYAVADKDKQAEPTADGGDPA